MQTTSHLLMIRPVNFGYNAETAVNNAFQSSSTDHSTHAKALTEFEDFVRLLRTNGVDVTVVDDTPEPYTPDSIFPNNWVSFHREGIVFLYPMFANSRRLERKPGVLDQLAKRFRIDATIDLSGYERENLFLEGTGSMVLDRDHRIAYACLSPRTDRQVLEEFCIKMDYQPEAFISVDGSNRPIYHTNVMMCVADLYVVICLDSIPESFQRDHVAETIINSGKEIVPITLDQMNRFAGNMLQINNDKGERLLVMSSQAYHSLTSQQVAKLETYNRIVHSDLTTIETNGGGSARCMLAEVHLPTLDGDC